MNNNYDYQRHGFLNAWEAVFLIKAFFVRECVRLVIVVEADLTKAHQVFVGYVEHLDSYCSFDHLFICSFS